MIPLVTSPVNIFFCLSVHIYINHHFISKSQPQAPSCIINILTINIYIYLVMILDVIFVLSYIPFGSFLVVVSIFLLQSCSNSTKKAYAHLDRRRPWSWHPPSTRVRGQTHGSKEGKMHGSSPLYSYYISFFFLTLYASSNFLSYFSRRVPFASSRCSSLMGMMSFGATSQISGSMEYFKVSLFKVFLFKLLTFLFIL